MNKKGFVIDRIMQLPATWFETMTTIEHFDGSFELKLIAPRGTTFKDVMNFSHMYSLLPDMVIFNEKKGATTLITESQTRLKDPKVTIVKTCKGDKFDKKYGFLLAYFQQNCGLSKTQANKYLKELVEEK